jgi:hypothetical protein
MLSGGRQIYEAKRARSLAGHGVDFNAVLG